MSTTDDLLTLAGAPTERVYAIGSVPASPLYPYRVIGYAPDVPAVRNMLADGDPRRRFTVQHFSRTADGLEAITADTFATFDGEPIDGDVCTQVVAGPLDRDPDDRGVLNQTHVYEF
jgi:hypothetical protein